MDDAWKKVHTASSDPEAHIIKGLLETNGITCKIVSMAVPQFPVTIDGLAEKDIFVMTEMYGKSRRILEEHLKYWRGDSSSDE